MGDFNVTSRKHPNYSSNATLWDFYIAAYKGGNSFASGYLETHRLENSEDFGKRKDAAYFLNFCRAIPNIYADHIFKNPITRPTFSPELLENVDGRGMDAQAFAIKISVLSSIYGQVHVLVDKPIAEEGITLADASLPYATIYAPQNLLDWARHPITGKLLWALLYEPIYEDTDPLTPRVTVERYRLLKPDGWAVYQNSDAGAVMVDSGDWALESVPLVTCFNKEIDDDMIGESALVDIAPTNRAIMNWCSCIDEQIKRQTFSQLIMPEDEDSENVKTIGTASIFTFPSDATHAPAFISPDAAQIATIWDMVANHIAEIYRMATLEKSGSSALVPQSGIAKAYDFIDTNGALVTKATQMESFETELYNLFALWMGKGEVDPVTYQKDFDVIALDSDIRNSLDLIAENFSDKYSSFLKKRLVRRTASNIPDETLVIIDKEIDEAKVMNLNDEGFGADESDNDEGETIVAKPEVG